MTQEALPRNAAIYPEKLVESTCPTCGRPSVYNYLGDCGAYHPTCKRPPARPRKPKGPGQTESLFDL